MADSKITKLEWVNTVKYIPPGNTATVELNNSFYTYTPDAKPKAFGRKPYLIAKEYVPVGEPYDYLAMMNTEWDLGANNAWVVNRKPYKFKDYHLMTTGYDPTGEPVEIFYPAKVYLVKFTDDARGLTIASVKDSASYTVVTIDASSDAKGSYYLYAEDGKGNRIYYIISSSVAVVHRLSSPSSSSPDAYVKFEELVSGEYATCTPLSSATGPFLTPCSIPKIRKKLESSFEFSVITIFSGPVA